MTHDEIEAAITEALGALRRAIADGYHDVAHTYSCVIERLHAMLRGL